MKQAFLSFGMLCTVLVIGGTTNRGQQTGVKDIDSPVVSRITGDTILPAVKSNIDLQIKTNLETLENKVIYIDTLKKLTDTLKK